MGTDIHFSAEKAVYNNNGIQTGWEFVPGPIVPCQFCEGTAIKSKWGSAGLEQIPGESCYWCTTEPDLDGDPDDYHWALQRYVGPGQVRDRWFSDRNYLVFAVLANVRNGSGFAGTYTHEPIVPISEPRGLPNDITEETDHILSYEHSQTWLNLEEVMSYDWQQSLVRGGTVNMPQYKVFLEKGAPETWSGMVGGSMVKNISTQEADEIIASGKDLSEYSNVYTHVKWETNMEQYAEPFLKRMTNLINALGQEDDGNPLKCRLVFDFDS